jgi:hypothetical protein
MRYTYKLKELAKELCEKSGCHHKCHDTEGCVVEDEALLLINENKSNNFDVKSNNELFKQALVEGVNNRIDKDLQIGEMVDDIDTYIESVDVKHWYSDELDEGLAERLYNEGWRKQRKGEWTRYSTSMMECSVCKRHTAYHRYKFCPHCGAKMKGGEE